MSNAKSLGILMPMLNPIGEKRLFEFLEIIDTSTAARFRVWLSSAAEPDVKAAAKMLNTSSHGQQFVGWWQTRDPNRATSDHRGVEQRSPTPLEVMHSQARARMAKDDLTVGGLWFVGGLVVTMISYAIAASNPHGSGGYIVATGAIIWGAIRVFRGLMAGPR